MWAPHINGLSTYDNDNPYPGRKETERYTSLTYRLQKDAELDRRDLLNELDRVDPVMDTQASLLTRLTRVLDAVGLQHMATTSRLEDLLNMIETNNDRKIRIRADIRAAHVFKNKKQRYQAPVKQYKGGVCRVFDLYTTPTDLVDFVYAQIYKYWKTVPNNVSFLEPSCGTGALVEGYYRYTGKKPDTLAVNDIFVDAITHVRRKRWPNCVYTNMDFMDMSTKTQYSLIVSSPPVTRFDWLRHLIHGVSMLQRGGCAAFIVPDTIKTVTEGVGQLARDYKHILHDDRYNVEYVDIPKELTPSYRETPLTLVVIMRRKVSDATV